MYKRILVPIDGSSIAELGLQEAIKLAKDQRASLRIVHILDDWLMVSPDASGMSTVPAADAQRAAGEAILNEAEKTAHRAGVDAETVLVQEIGEGAGPQIVGQAVEWRADLIVCGTHGRHGIRRLLMGSDAEYIVRHSPTPVLLLHGAPEETT